LEVPSWRNIKVLKLCSACELGSGDYMHDLSMGKLGKSGKTRKASQLFSGREMQESTTLALSRLSE
jgi:hypothetical protein